VVQIAFVCVEGAGEVEGQAKDLLREVTPAPKKR
jgi:hypothetical protein